MTRTCRSWTRTRTPTWRLIWGAWPRPRRGAAGEGSCGRMVLWCSGAAPSSDLSLSPRHEGSRGVRPPHRLTRPRRGTSAPARESRHGDDDLAARVPLLEVAQAGIRIGQGEGAVEDGCEFPGLDERG